MLIAWYAGLIFCLSVVAFIASMMGIGGGVLYTPIQLLFGVGIHQAAANSLFLIMILCIAATCIYHCAGRVDWKMAAVLEISTASGGFAGGYVSEYISETVLTIILIAVLLFAAFLMIVNSRDQNTHNTKPHRWYSWVRRINGDEYVLNLALAMPVSLLAGLLSGMVGVGGGVIKVPMMVMLGVPIDIAIATSALMVGITAAGGFAGHLLGGHWDYKLSLILAPGVFVGAQLGARFMLRMEKERLKKIFGVLMIIIAAVVAFRVL